MIASSVPDMDGDSVNFYLCPAHIESLVTHDPRQDGSQVNKIM